MRRVRSFYICISSVKMLLKWDVGRIKKKKAWANWYWNVLVVASYFWLPASQLTFALLPLFMRLSIKKCGYFPLQSSHYYEKVICLPYFHNNLTGRDSILVNIMHCLALATVCFWIFSSFFFFFFRPPCQCSPKRELGRKCRMILENVFILTCATLPKPWPYRIV